MVMDHEDMFNKVCAPSFSRIEGKVDELMKAVAIGNGKPSLLARVASLEERGGKAAGGADDGCRCASGKSIKIGTGPASVQLDGYSLSDVGKLALAALMVWVLWSSWTGRRADAERIERLANRVDVAAGARP